MTTQSHEPLTSFRTVAAGSSRKFGVTVGLILCVLAVVPLIRHHAPIRWWLLAIGLVLFAFGLVAPRWLDPVNRLWFRLGLLLARITNPVVMGVMFFCAVVPFAWLIRRLGHDLLRLRRDPDAASYWIPKDAAGTAPLTKQF